MPNRDNHEPYPFPECPILSQVIQDSGWDPFIEMPVEPSFADTIKAMED